MGGVPSGFLHNSIPAYGNSQEDLSDNPRVTDGGICYLCYLGRVEKYGKAAPRGSGNGAGLIMVVTPVAHSFKGAAADGAGSPSERRREPYAPTVIH